MDTLDTLHTYLPQDRLRALVYDAPLPDRTTGAALFADISGFTPLTEALRTALGPRRGAEALTQKLDEIYTALITQVEHHGGSVIDFAGDAIMCWFDDAPAPSAAEAHVPDSLPCGALRATACAGAMQDAMRAFATVPLPHGAPERATSIALKIAVATGPARRFAVGDPTICRLDTLAGATVARTATGEHLAQKGDVLVDEATATALGLSTTADAHASQIQTWRTAETGERFAVLTPSLGVPATPFAPVPVPAAAVLQTWIHAPVFTRAHSRQGLFNAEFRPCVVLFVRFVGIDYDADESLAQCDAFMRLAQSVAARYDGTVLQITIGDKGTFSYINFGALSTHEDDARRAVQTALELRASARTLGFLAPLQIGITQGVLCVGPYGSPTRRTFGALGDDVNLAARFMMQAAPDEILLTSAVYKSVAHLFACAPRGSLTLKGKAKPVPAFAVTAERQERAVRLQEPHYALPLVGRRTELKTIHEKLQLALQGQAQVIGIVAEAGLGKSRLVAEVIRMARQQGFAGYGGACQSDAINTPYQPWKAIWQAFFDVDPAVPLSKQLTALTELIATYAPERVQALPLLSILLNLAIPDNDFTQALEPKYRQSALWALLEDCLCTATRVVGATSGSPLLIVIEDLHWIDALSYNLLEGLARALTASPICFVLAYRPPQLARLAQSRLEGLPHFTKIPLSELTPVEAEQAIRAKLVQLYPEVETQALASPQASPSAQNFVSLLVEKLMARAQGNPFYLEELLNFLHDRGLDPHEPSALHQIELPDSLHTLILSRIDQLSEHEKTILRVASIIGRVFSADWLTGYYPDLGDTPQVQSDLEQLAGLDITPLETPEPELAYLFKHIITHEVTYESLPFATRARLHEQLAVYLESVAAPLDVIAEHYGRSENSDKQRTYFQQAGDAAQAAYANDAALAYYALLLPLLTEARDQRALYMKRGAVLELTGQWAEAEAHYRAALALAVEADRAASAARCQQALGVLLQQRGDYDTALTWLAQARTVWETLNDHSALGHTLVEISLIYWRKGDHAEARRYAERGLALARDADDRRGMARALHTLGLIANNQGDYPTARAMYAESLTLKRELDDKYGIAWSLNGLGIVAWYQGDYATARALHTESLALKREMGDKHGIALSLNNLGLVAFNQGDLSGARTLYAESLALQREMGNKQGTALSLGNLGNVALDQGDYPDALALHAESLALRREMGDKLGMAMSLNGLGHILVGQGDYAAAWTRYTESLTLSQEIGRKAGYVWSLAGLAASAAGLGDAQRAAWLASAAEALRVTLKLAWEPTEQRLYERAITTGRAALSAEAFDAAWSAGARLTSAEAVAHALQEPAPSGA